MNTTSELAVQSPVPRHYGLDWLRIGAFLLLMLYHVGMAFVTGDWLVKLAQIQALAYPMLFLTPWRLAVLFIVSGYASRALLTRLPSLGAFLRERSLRLLIPLGAAMALIIPPQSWIGLVTNHGYVQDFGYFLKHDWLRFGQLDGVTLPGWEHLWFVAYLWLFTVALTLILATLPAGLAAWLKARFEALGAGSRLLWVPLAYLVPARIAVTFTTGESHGLFDDWLSDIIYLPLFLFGFALAGTTSLWPAIARLWKPALALALISYGVLATVETLYPGHNTPPHALMALDRAAIAGMMWGMSLTMLQLANTLLDRDHRWRKPLSEAVFPFYILHQTAIVVIAWWLLPMGLGAPIEAAIILSGTALACILFWQAGRQFGWFGSLIGLSRPRRPMARLEPQPAE